jgi:hypothetical protein
LSAERVTAVRMHADCQLTHLGGGDDVLLVNGAAVSLVGALFANLSTPAPNAALRAQLTDAAVRLERTRFEGNAVEHLIRATHGGMVYTADTAHRVFSEDVSAWSTALPLTSIPGSSTFLSPNDPWLVQRREVRV